MTKSYRLKTAESNLLRFVQQHQQAVFAGVLSNIASESFGYVVDEHTQFEVSADYAEVKVTQIDQPEEDFTPKDKKTKSAVVESKTPPKE